MIPFLLAAGTFAVVNKKVNGGRRIGAIVTKEQLRKVTACNDGSFSTAKHRPCRTRGGVKNPKRLSLIQRIECAFVQWRPLDKIHIDTKSFQQRKQAFSEESVQRIIRAVENGTFRWEILDAFLLWRNPQNKRTYVLASHSRLEAFKRLYAKKIRVNGRGFGRAPVKIIDATYEEAMTIALMSNTLSTPETIIERANYYRILMANGTNLAKIERTAKEYEGKNASTILSYMYLNPNGKALNAAGRLQNAEANSRRIAESTAAWLGFTRKRLPNLSNLHEDEMYDFLIQTKNRAKFRRNAEFSKFIRKIVERRTVDSDFGPNAILNLKNAKRVEAVLDNYKIMLANAQRDLREAKQIRDLKLQSIAKRNKLQSIAKRNDTAEIQAANIKRIMPKYDNAVIRAEQKLNHLKKKSKQMEDAQQRTLTLDDAFGINGLTKNNNNVNLKHRKKIRKAIAFYPIQEQAKYADGVCMEIANNHEAIISAFGGEEDKDNFEQWNATRVGNMAYLYLHSPFEDVKQVAANALNGYKDYVTKIGSTAESPLKYLPYAAAFYAAYKIIS
ncbi:MAG: hypothetical protein ACPG5B_06735 [Chitinophagales bacterium]